MAKYRYTDRQEINEHGQTLGFALWMGGPSLTYVGNAVCEDGSTANWFKSAEPSLHFAIPGYVHRKGRRVSGSLVANSGEPYRFVAHRG